MGTGPTLPLPVPAGFGGLDSNSHVRWVSVLAARERRYLVSRRDVVSSPWPSLPTPAWHESQKPLFIYRIATDNLSASVWWPVCSFRGQDGNRAEDLYTKRCDDNFAEA